MIPVQLLSLALVFLTLTGAAEVRSKLFPQENITTEEWQALLAEVKAKPGARDAPLSEQPDIEAIVVPEEHAIYYFTTGGPAHPAVIAFRPVQVKGAAAVMHIESYFAGSREEFEKWHVAFLVSLFPGSIPRKPPQ